MSAIFTFAVSTVLIANYIQVSTTAPLDYPALGALRATYHGDQGNDELREQIRVLDLLARKAFFTRQWQARVGMYLALGGAGLLAASLRLISVLSRKSPVVVGPAQAGRWAASPRTRMLFVIFGATMTASALIAAVLTHRSLDTEYGRETTLTADTTGDSDAFSEKAQANWPSFRGPGGAGIVLSRRPPLDWDGATGRNVLWKVPVPLAGFSSPIVWDTRVFLTGGSRESREVYCYHAQTGELLWRSSIGPFPGSPSQAPDVAADTGYAASTPATDGRRVFAVFATGDIACLDINGRLLWGQNLGVPENHYGHSSSLIVHRDLLIVQYDHTSSARIMALDAETGRTVWQTEREIDAVWSSPILVQADPVDLIAVTGSPYFAAYRLDSGAELWRVEGILGEVASSPAYDGQRIVAVNQLMSIIAVDPGDGRILWETFDDLPDAASPLAVGGLAFIATSFGTITCFLAETGAIAWKQEFDEGFYASPVSVDGNVFALDRSGTMRIFEASASYTPLASPSLGETADTTPAFVQGRIYIRGQTHLFCLEEDGAI